MNVKFILPALTEARGVYGRPIKYSLFPPLGLATLAGYLQDSDHAVIVDEHVEDINLNDRPDLVVIQVYVTSAYRAYEIADHYRRKGLYVVLGGLHTTALPEEAARHADTICLGPGEDTWPHFLADFRKRQPRRVYQSTQCRPDIRQDPIHREHDLVPETIVMSSVNTLAKDIPPAIKAMRKAIKPFILSFVCFMSWLFWEMAWDKVIYDPHVAANIFAGYMAGNLIFVIGYFIGMGLVLEIFLNVFMGQTLSHKFGKALVFFCALDHFFFWL